jgi:mannan endo-1,4-beta-mannosidase
MVRSLVIAAALLVGQLAHAQNIRFEAENSLPANRISVNFANSVGGYSGTGYLTDFDSQANNDRYTMQVNIPQGLYELWVGYRSQFGEKGYTYTVGSSTGNGMFDQSTTFTSDRAGLFNLPGGTTTIGIRENWGFYDIDYMEFRPFTPPALLPVSTQLSDAQADANAQHLMNYMTSIYGQHTLAGHQHEESESPPIPFPSSTYLNLSGGRRPSLRSSDFMDYSPSRVQFGASGRNETEQSIEWARKTGGVVSMMWHWNAPTDLVNTPCGQSCGPNDYPWWRGFYTQGTTFDWAGALANPSGEDYQLILRDIDAVAAELQKFEDAGVPVIWRPLHEAQGNASGTSGNGAWFWWGADGPGAFKDLWRLMHDRLTDHHGLHNLIWEFTSSTNSGHLNWYPGDDVVDMIGLDVYTTASDNMSGQWYDILAHYNGRKLIALSESGTLPNADAMQVYGIDWSYFSLWKDGFLDDFSAAQVQALLNSAQVITEDELPLLPWSALDFNRDGDIDAADYAVWRKFNGLSGANLPADGNLSGQVNTSDRTLWRTNFGRTTFDQGGSGGEGVPEPAAATLVLFALAISGATSRRFPRPLFG